MATQTIVLGNTPVRISDGTKRVFAESVNGDKFRCAVSTTMPDKKSFHTPSELHISEGFSVWVWKNSRTPVSITVSTAD